MTKIIHAVLVGRPAPLGPKQIPSTIAARRLVQGPVAVTSLGLAGDAVGDPRIHGGPEKAVHLYPRDHYAAWAAELPQLAPHLTQPGAFGENLSVAGLTEADVCLGDIVRAGATLLQLCQSRQPCWKLGVRFGLPTLPRLFQQSGRTGWYYRVLEPGFIGAGDRMELFERPNPAWTVARLIRTLYVDTMDQDALAELSTLPGISANLKGLAEKRLMNRTVESWDRRLTGD